MARPCGIKNGTSLLRNIISEFADDVEFNTQQVMSIGRERFGVELESASSQLNKMSVNGYVKCIDKRLMQTPHGRRTVCVWIKTSKAMSMEIPELYCEPSPFDGWKKVWPELFNKYPMPVGRVHKLEL